MKVAVVFLFWMATILLFPVAYGEEWSFLDSPENMKGISSTYEVCDSLMRDEYTGESGGCYTTTLNFFDVFATDVAAYLLAVATTEINNEIRNELLLINTQTFEVRSVDQRQEIAESLSQTVFWLGKITKEINLTEGQQVAKLNSYFPDDVPIIVRKKITQDESERYILGYTLLRDSTITVDKQLPLPVSASIYSTTNIYPKQKKIFGFNYIESASVTTPTVFEPIKTDIEEISFTQNQDTTQINAVADNQMQEKKSSKREMLPAINNRHYAN